jgi:hypothetical protein
MDAVSKLKVRGSTYMDTCHKTAAILTRSAWNKLVVERQTKKQALSALKNSHVYTPIQNELNFRLVKILPGRFGAPLKCELVHGLIEGSSFEALSYAWGSTKLEKPISVNGVRFKITKNLYLALLHLRREKVSRIMWIDAISINQQDLIERGHQVQYMREIYRNATCVIIWLGLSSKRIEGLFKRASSVDFSSPLDIEDVGAAVELLFRPWWSRVWVRLLFFK